MPVTTPPAVVNFINVKTNESLKRSDPRALLAKTEVDAVGGTPQEFAKFISAETAKYAALIKRAGISAESPAPREAARIMVTEC